MKIQAAIFDVDGTLIDSVDLHARAWQEAFQHFGKTVPFEDVRVQIGKGADQLLPVFFSEEQLRSMGKDLEAFRSQLFKKEYLPQIKGFPAVRPLFQKLRQDGIEIALASSAKGDELAAYKRLVNIEDLISDETSQDDVAHSKPSPDIFLAAHQRLGNPPPSLTRVIGDTPYDAQAAVAAGLPIIGVLCGGFPERGLREAGCRQIFRDPQDLLSHYQDWTGDQSGVIATLENSTDASSL